jgi:tRNA modification GTPase
VLKPGIPVAIVGKTNAGKSTLLNRLLKEEKAIVSEIAGTTRDYIEDAILINGVQFRFIDTAGLRHTNNKIESLGIERTRIKMMEAMIILHVIDASQPDSAIDEAMELARIDDEGKMVISVINKTDKATTKRVEQVVSRIHHNSPDNARVVKIAAKYENQIAELESELQQIANTFKPGENEIVVSNARHYEALGRAHDALRRAGQGIKTDVPSDLVAQDVRQVLYYLGEITGEITTDEVLGNIFKNFCIGK